MNVPRVTLAMAAYKRPQRTVRSIECIKAQTLQNFEAIVIGDGCPEFEGARRAIGEDPRFVYFNTLQNYGGYGYWQINWAIQNAKAPYFMFYANDDKISPVHLKQYTEAIEGTNNDFMYFDYLMCWKRVKAKLKFGYIGHCALIIRTEFLRRMPPHGSAYGHDNVLIDNMLKAGAKYEKGKILPTYYIMNYNKTRTDMEGLD